MPYQSTNFKALSIIFAALFSFHCVTAQQSKFGIYFKCVGKENKRAIDTFGISYGNNFPFYGLTHKAIIVSKDNIDKVQYREVGSLKIQFNTLFIYVEPGDTILYKINPNNRISYVYQYKALQDYGTTEKAFYETTRLNNPQLFATTTSLRDNISLYKQYRQLKQKFIDSLFAGRKPALRAYLQEYADYVYLFNIAGDMRKLRYTSEDSLAFINAVTTIQNFESPAYASSNELWRIFVGNYAEVLSGSIQQPYEPLKYSRMIAAAKKHFSPQIYQKFLLWTLDRFSNIAIPEYELIAKNTYGELGKMNFAASEKTLIDKKYKEIVQMSKQLSYFGQIALRDKSGKALKLKEVLQPKKLYLFDFWASWCAPCIEQIPELKRISEKYPDVQIISLSIDENKDAWLKASEKYKVEDKGNYLVSKLTRNELLENYNIKDIPRFLLFDGNGKCITSNGPRPSDASFEGYLKQYLSK